MYMQFRQKSLQVDLKLNAHAIYWELQSYCVGCRSTHLGLRNVVLLNEHKLKIFERGMLRK